MGRKQKKLKKRYGRLKVIGKRFRQGNNYLVPVHCDCGEETYVWVHNLQTGKTKSCGCIEIERLTKQVAQRAREQREQVAVEKKRRKLRKIASDIARESEPFLEISDTVFIETDEIARKIIQEYKCGDELDNAELRLRYGEISLQEYRKEISPILSAKYDYEVKVSRINDHVDSIMEKLLKRAQCRGKQAIVRAGLMSEALFSQMTAKPFLGGETEAFFVRVAARSFLTRLKKLKTNPKGIISERLFVPIPKTYEPLRCYLAENRRQRINCPPKELTGVVSPTTSLPADSIATAV